MTSTIRELRQMDPQQRQQAIDSDKYRAMFSAQEREMLKGVLRLPLAPVNAQKQDTPPPTQAPQ